MSALLSFFINHQLDRTTTLKHFCVEGINSRRIFRVMARGQQGQSIVYNKNSGPAPTACTDKNVKRITRLFGRAPKTTVRDDALKCEFSTTSMAKLRKKAGITSATRIKVPKMSED